MGGKRRAQPSGKEEGKTANGDGAAAEGGGSQKRQTLGLSVHGAAAGSGEHLVPVTMIFSVRFDPSALAGRKAALEAALRKVVMEFGGRDFKVGQLKVGASEDTLQRVLPFLIERVEPEGAAHLFQVCKPWRREMEARGFCNRTVQLCSAMAGDGDAGVGGWGSRITLRGLDPTMDMDTAARDLCADANAFLERSFQSKGDLRAWLQAASQETGGSFFERGAASTAECLGLHLVKWVGKPRGRFPGPLSIVRGHSDIVRAVAFSPDGTRIASASEDELVKIWNAATGQEVCALVGHPGKVSLVAFSPDGTRIVSGSVFENVLQIWNAETGAEVCTLEGHEGGVNSAGFSPDGKRVVSGSEDGLVKIWNAETGAEECTLAGHDGDVNTVSFSPDGTRVVSGSHDMLVKIWDVATGQELRTLVGHSDLVLTASFSPDGTRVVSGAYDMLVKIWDAATGQEILSLQEHNGQGLCLCMMDEHGSLERGEDGMPFTYEGCPIGHTKEVSLVRFSDDGLHVISGSSDQTVRVWDVASGRQVRTLAGGDFTLVEGLSDPHKKNRHVLTARGDMLLIYAGVEGQQRDASSRAGGAGAAPVACFKAPQTIITVRCHGSVICVGCMGGAVCVLSAPFLTA